MTAEHATERLESALEEITRLCGELRDVMTEERTALIAARRDLLPGLLRRKDEGFRRLSEAEEQRRRCAHQLERAWGWAPVDRPLSRLAPRLAPEARERLAERKNRLLAVMKDLCALNDANGRLIRQALTVGRRLLDWAASPVDSLYGPTGLRRESTGRVVHERA